MRPGRRPANRDLAAVTRRKPEDQLDQRGFARAVMAQKRNTRAFGDRQRHVVQNGRPAAQLADMGTGENVGHDPLS